MVKLCIFDLDGTVLDTIGTIAYYGNEALKKHGIAPIDVEEYKYLVGNGAADLVKKMLIARECYSDALYARVFHDYNVAYNKDVAYQTTIYDGLPEVLDTLRARGMRMAIVSNKPDFATQTVIKALYGENYFDFVTGQKEGVPLKPDPTVVNAVMEKFGVTPNECVYVGDTSTDMKTGKRAGIFTVGVLWGFRKREELVEHGADALAENPHELLLHILDRG